MSAMKQLMSSFGQMRVAANVNLFTARDGQTTGFEPLFPGNEFPGAPRKVST